MKKDMGGAATALALAHMIMARGLKVRLRVIIPAVENSISGTSFRPRDIYASRKGISVEIGNTDAEGRLILADALALADEDKPALIADFATLTGAARVALGPDVAPFFTDDDTLADELAARRRRRERPALAHAAVAALRGNAGFKGRRSQQRGDRRPWRRSSRPRCSCGASSPAKSWAAFRYFRLDARGQARTSGRRRMPDGARALCVALRPLFLTMVALDPRMNPFRPEIAAKHLQGQVEASAFCRRHPLPGDRPCRSLAPRAVARGKARHRSAAGRARDDLRIDRGRLGLGPA